MRQRAPIYTQAVYNGLDLVGHVVELATGQFEAVDIRGRSLGRYNTSPAAVRALTREPGHVE